MKGRSRDGCLHRRTTQLPAFLRRPGGFYRLLFPADADLFQERLDRLFATEEFFNGSSDIAAVALFVNFVAQSQTGLFVEITVLRFFKYSGHVGSDRIGPGITVVTGIIAVQVSKISHE